VDTAGSLEDNKQAENQRDYKQAITLNWD